MKMPTDLLPGERDLLERLHITDVAEVYAQRTLPGPTVEGVWRRKFRAIWKAFWEHQRDRGLVGDEANPSNWKTADVIT